MAGCSDCDIGGFSYKFSNNAANFHAAQTECTKLGGHLAKNLNEHIYRMLNKCCSTQLQYWIGLVYDSSCNNQGNNRYHWIGDTNTCVNAGPLKLTPQNIERCQAVTILFQSSSKNIPQAQQIDCTSDQRYICQIPNTTIHTKIPVSTRTRTTQSVPTTTSQTSSSLLYTSSAKTTSIIDQTRSTNAPSVNSGIIAGVVMSCVIMLMLLVVLYLWRLRRKEMSSIICLSCEKRNHQKQQDTSNDVTVDCPVYYGINDSHGQQQTQVNSNKKNEVVANTVYHALDISSTKPSQSNIINEVVDNPVYHGFNTAATSQPETYEEILLNPGQLSSSLMNLAAEGSGKKDKISFEEKITSIPSVTTNAAADYQEVDIIVNDTAIFTTNEKKILEQTDNDEGFYNTLMFSQASKK